MYKTIVSSLFLFLLCSGVMANETSVANAQDVRDPTTPLDYAGMGTQAGGQQLALNSILVSTQRKLATINGNALREGEVVPGSADVKVQRILNQAVILQQADKTWVLRLSPSILKRH